MQGITKEEAENEEKRLIKLLDATNPLHGYNMTFGGETGIKVTNDVKNKISKTLTEYYKNEEVRKHQSESHIGKRHSEETKKKMSESHRARMTPEFRKMLGENRKGMRYPNRKGHPHSEDTKRKISESKRGKHFGGIGRKPRPVICVETGVIYESAVAAAKEIGCGFGGIYNACKDISKTSHGLHWQYADEYNNSSEAA